MPLKKGAFGRITRPNDGQKDKRSHINAFFAKFAGFDYDPKKEVMDEWRRLAESQEWDKKQEKAQRRRLRGALVDELNTQYGVDERRPASWQTLCKDVRVDPLPANIEECKQILARTHVNLVDLVDAGRRGQQGSVEVYKTVEKLRDYTLMTEKFFPKEIAKAAGLLRHLLRIFHR